MAMVRMGPMAGNPGAMDALVHMDAVAVAVHGNQQRWRRASRRRSPGAGAMAQTSIWAGCDLSLCLRV